jgi:AcrR family transcriptional regulator
MPRPRPTAGDRVVQAAIRRIHERGISIGLDGISLEDAIASSGVSRATAYRHWPSRADFLRAVLVQIVRETRLEPEGTEEIDAIRAFIHDRREDAKTEAGRRTIVVESLRIAVDADFRRLASSREWSDYLALNATCTSLPEGQLRETVTSEIAAAERGFVMHRASVYSRLPELIGYRLVPPLSGQPGFEVMADAMGALMIGLVVRASAAPNAASFRARAFGSSLCVEWTSTSYALVAAFLSFLEPDPEVEWTAERVMATVAAFEELTEAIQSARRPR